MDIRACASLWLGCQLFIELKEARVAVLHKHAKAYRGYTHKWSIFCVANKLKAAQFHKHGALRLSISLVQLKLTKQTADGETAVNADAWNVCIVFDISSLLGWHIAHSAKPFGLSGLFFYFKASTFFPRNYPTPNIQVGVVEHLWNLALWTDFPAIPATKLQISAAYLFFIINGFIYSSLHKSDCEAKMKNQSSCISKCLKRE